MTIKIVTEKIANDNSNWIARLTGDKIIQQAALTELRNTLIKNLRSALSGKDQVNADFLEDSAQDALMIILNKLDQFEGRSQFLTWATAIAVRTAMNKLRRKEWKNLPLDPNIHALHIETSSAFGSHSAPEQELVRKNILKKMYDVIENSLTEKQRTALLAELNETTLDEIAVRLKSNRNAIYKLTHDARIKLKHNLKSAGFDITDINTAFKV